MINLIKHQNIMIEASKKVTEYDFIKVAAFAVVAVFILLYRRIIIQ